ncbi:MAG: AAA family ATPase [Armatimonadota bacterium]
METLIPRFFKLPHDSFFLLGPRGTGKSTWLRHVCPEGIWIDLLEPETFRSYSARPERLTEIAATYTDKRTIIIDEIQKIPELLSVVHLLIERKTKIRFILTGSSSRKIKKTGTDLLAGRAVKKTLHPFMAAEMGQKFNLNKALKYGLLPLVVSAADPISVLRTYAALYVQEEVKMEGLVRNIGNFSRFLEAISFSHASLLNVTNVSRECQVERKTVEGYISILEDLLLSFYLPIFTKRAKRSLVAHSKFYYFDAGIFRSLRPSGPLDRPQEIDGCALEGLVAQHLMAWNSYRNEKNKIYFWRTAAGTEVDFVVYGEEVFWAIEVKNTANINPKDLRALKTFKEDYPESSAYLIYRGKERVLKDNILCIPCEEFLLGLNPEKTEIF